MNSIFFIQLNQIILKMPSIKNKLVISLLIPLMIILLFHMIAPYVYYPMVGVVLPVPGLIDLIGIYALFLWIIWGLIIFITFSMYERCKLTYENTAQSSYLNDVSDKGIRTRIRRFFNAKHPEFFRLCFVLFLPWLMFISALLLGVMFREVNSLDIGGYIPIGIHDMIFHHTVMGYLIMVAVIFIAFYWHDLKSDTG